MLKEHRQFFAAVFIAADLMVVALAWALAWVLRFNLELVPVTKGVPPLGHYLVLLPVLFGIWWLVLRANGLYEPGRGRAIFSESRALLRASSLAMLVFTSVSFLGFEKAYSLSRLMLVYFWLLVSVGLVLERAAVREFLREVRRRGFNLRHVLVVGDGALALAVGERLSAHPEHGLKVRGYLTDDPTRIGRLVSGAPVLGVWNDVAIVAATAAVDQVVFALPFEAMPRLENLISLLDELVLDVRVVPDVERFVSLRSRIDDLDGMALITLRATPLAGWGRLAKRFIDIVGGAAALVVFGPLMLLISALLKIGPRGPVLYRQERMGLDGRVFSVCKFRTMRTDAEQVSGPVWATEDDSRTTAIGRVLRRFSLDELPQLWSVVRGEMSLVGPRPERPVFIEEFRRHIPRYMLRHMVQAGMTGWAQVHGWRGNTSVETRIEYDLDYIQNWSLLLDFKILGLTLVRGFSNRNAY